jgi:hypothetical protein
MELSDADWACMASTLENNEATIQSAGIR